MRAAERSETVNICTSGNLRVKPMTRVYKSKAGPFGFKPAEVDDRLRQLF